MITLYGAPNTRSIRVMWMLEELQQPYEFKALDFSKGDSQASEFLAINPSGKVPALCIDDFVMTESAAMNTYLGDKFGARHLIPEPGTELRGKYEQWCYFALSELEQPLWTMSKHKFAIPAEHRVDAIMPTAEWEFQKALRLFSLGLHDNNYILGDSFSAADILLCHTLFWAMSSKLNIEQDNIRDYIDRIRTRPALAAAMVKETPIN